MDIQRAFMWLSTGAVNYYCLFGGGIPWTRRYKRTPIVSAAET